MNNKALNCFTIANLRTNLALRPISLNSASNNKAKTNRISLYLG